MFNIVKRFYDRGYYTEKDVKVFKNSGAITEEQYRQILGIPEEPVEQEEEPVVEA